MHPLRSAPVGLAPRPSFFLALTLLAVLTGAGPASAAPDGRAPALRPPRVADAPRIDGLLDEAVWRQGVTAGDFVQQRPDTGSPASQPTEVRIVYTGEALYLGFTCWDDDPAAIVRQNLGRDADVTADDYLLVVLDTYHDRQNGYLFQTNPNGVRWDALFRAEGASDQINVDWDGVWKAACRVTATGWQGEIEIPWRTLRFAPADGLTMGLNLERQRRSVNEQSQWAPTGRQFSALRVSRAGTLQGLSGIAPGANVLLRPYALATLARGDADDPDAWTDGTWEDDGEVGYDLKVGLTSNLTLDVTVNTDFAQVEVDDQQVNLTRFPLFFPEKREFFLENRDHFAFGSPANRPFFSRRIGLDPDGETIPIDYGTRLTGKIGRTDIGLLDIKTRGGEGDDRYDVARVSQDVGRRSRVGGLVVARTAEGGGVWNRVYGLDADLRPTEDLDLSFYGAFSDESEAGPAFDPPEYGDRPRDGVDHGTWGGRLRYSRPSWYGIYLYEVYGRDYAPRAGFLPRRDLDQHAAELGWTPEPNAALIRRFENYLYGQWISRRDGTFESRYLEARAAAVGPGEEVLALYGSSSFERLFEPFVLGEVVFAPGDFDFARVGAELSSDPSRALQAGVSGEWGPYYDGRLDSYQGSLMARFAPHWTLSIEGEWNRLRRDDAIEGTQRLDADVVRLRLGWDASNSLAVDLFSQWNSVSDRVVSQLRLHWIFGDESDLYLVLADARTDFEHDLAPRATGLTTKLAYAWRL